MADIREILNDLDEQRTCMYEVGDDACGDVITDAIQVIEELQSQIPKWHLVNDCDFCKNIKIGIPNWTFIDDELETFKNSSGIAVEIRNVLKEPCLVFTNSADEYGYGYIKINYCPYCGKKIKVVE